MYRKKLQEIFLSIAKLNLTNEQYRVFFVIFSKIKNFDEYLPISQTEIAKELGMKQPNISKAIKGLLERNIIIEGPRAGMIKTYKLNIS